MRILYVNTYFYPDMYGGTEKVVYDIAASLIQDNQVYVLCLGEKDEELVYDGINVVRIYNGYKLYPTKIFDKIRNKIIDTFGFKKSKIKKTIKNINPDIVHTHGLPGFSSYIWKICKSLDVKMIDTVHDYWKYSMDGEEKHIFKAFNVIHHYFFRKNSKYVSVVTAPTNFMLKYVEPLHYYPNSKKKTVLNGFRIDYLAMKTAYKNREKKAEEKINVLYVGQLIHKKGIKELIDCFLNYNEDKLRLYICGAGELEEYVYKQSEKNECIVYLGKKNKEELLSVYKTSDILFVPSLWNEPFGLVTIEGLINGLIVCGSSYGGIGENLKRLNINTIFDPNNRDDFEKIIKNTCTYQYINNYYRTFQYEHFEKRISDFLLDSVVKQYYDLYDKLSE